MGSISVLTLTASPLLLSPLKRVHPGEVAPLALTRFSRSCSLARVQSDISSRPPAVHAANGILTCTDAASSVLLAAWSRTSRCFFESASIVSSVFTPVISRWPTSESYSPCLGQAVGSIDIEESEFTSYLWEGC